MNECSACYAEMIAKAGLVAPALRETVGDKNDKRERTFSLNSATKLMILTQGSHREIAIRR